VRLGVRGRSTIVEALKSCSHNGFPVYDHDEKMTTLQGQRVVTHRGALLGLMLRSQLLVLLKHREFVFQGDHADDEPPARCAGTVARGRQSPGFRRHSIHKAPSIPKPRTNVISPAPPTCTAVMEGNIG
jgi:hypothetical protein